jgi:hypothetical protein
VESRAPGLPRLLTLLRTLPPDLLWLLPGRGLARRSPQRFYTSPKAMSGINFQP